MRDFLEAVPPGTERLVKDINLREPGSGAVRLCAPMLRLHCDQPACGGERHFVSTSGSVEAVFKSGDRFLTYSCRNCSRSFKTYALQYVRAEGVEGHVGTVLKFGEVPSFGPPIPPAVFRLTGNDRDLFLRGRRSENQGLGLGAITYYRRVVEDQWKRLLAEIIRVAEKLEMPQSQLDSLRRAEAEIRFSRAVEITKDAIPASLLIDGHHNPLTLLHAALSEDIHLGSEQRCLELAEVVRVVLFDLSDRLQMALREKAELRGAISALLNRQQSDPTSSTSDDTSGPGGAVEGGAV